MPTPEPISFPAHPENLPSPERFPHNERGASAFAVLDQDQHQATDLLLLVPSTDRRGLIRLLSRRADLSPTNPCRLRVLLERPLSAYTRWRSLREDELERVFREDWLKQGISLDDAPAILGAQRLLHQQNVEARVVRQDRPLRVAGQLTDTTLVLGGSAAGVESDSKAMVALVRFSSTVDPTRLSEGRALCEALWEQGHALDLGAVLDGLLALVSWEAALARAIALILEGDWARCYVPPHELEQLEKPLLKHQLSGLGQALWLLDHVGALLVADPTGSGKTRLGAWILRAAYDRCARSGGALPRSPLLLAPPAMKGNWEEALIADARLSWRVASHGKLIARRRRSGQGPPRPGLQDWIRSAEVIAVDEAHNFHNLGSKRSRALLEHFADHVLLFTATPISRTATDLHSLVELLGADHLSDAALRAMDDLSRSRSVLREQRRLQILQEAVASFTLRRTRAEVDEILRKDPQSKFRYPTRTVKLYDVSCPPEDLTRLERIVALAGQLRGVHLVGQEIRLSPTLAETGWSEERYLKALPKRCAALARFVVLSAVRSSRAAAWELIRGTSAARAQYRLPAERSGKRDETGDVVTRLRRIADKVPDWHLDDALKLEAVAWLWDPRAHRLASEEDSQVYERILDEVRGLTEALERARSGLLAQLVGQGSKVLAFERRLITLDVLQEALCKEGFPVHMLTGSATENRENATLHFGLESPPGAQLGLLSDAFAEGFNLQGANTLVHLDFPTVLRVAEQRTGRIDRMDSPHAQIDVHLPRDPEILSPKKGEALIYRDWMSGRVFGGSNMEYPEELYDETLDREAFGRRLETPEDDLGGLDAFRPLRDLIGADGLIRDEIYAAEREQREPMTACISAVWGEKPWAFFAIRGAEGEAPRWIMKTSPTDPPVVDLGRIAALLRERLSVSTLERPEDPIMGRYIEQHLRALEREEICLLRYSQQRALNMIQEHLKERLDRGLYLNTEQRDQLSICLDVLQRRTFDGKVPDLRRLGEVCLNQLRPLRLRWHQRPRPRRRQLFRMSHLVPMLKEHPLDLEALQQQLVGIPQVSPLRERLFVAIIAVPAQYEAGPTAATTQSGAQRHGE